MKNKLNPELESNEFLKIIFSYEKDDNNKIDVASYAAITTPVERLIIVRKLIDMLKEVTE